MAAALALLPQILALLPTVEVGVEHLIAWIQSIRTAAKQSGEWTPDLETAFLNSLVAWAGSPALQPDSPASAAPAAPSPIPAPGPAQN